MSWEHPQYSFGNPNAQPPTPTQTPTSAVFPSPTFQTPRFNSNNFELHSGWTPKFAEEYSVFNATPGRLTSGTFPSFVETTPRPSTAASSGRNPSTTEELAQEIASHVNHTVTTTLPLPPVDPSRQLSSSPGNAPQLGQGGIAENKIEKQTPRRPRRRLEEAFSAQTATPPRTASKQSRKLGSVSGASTMQPDQETMTMFGTPGQQTMLDFSNMGDIFAYPMSAPATAPAFTQTKTFWDPDASMGGMGLDYSGAESHFFDDSTHRINNSFDWGRSNQAFQQTSNAPQFSPVLAHVSDPKRPRPLAAKPNSLSSATNNSFTFGGSLSDDPFAIAASTGAVDPGLLFTIPPDHSIPPFTSHSRSLLGPNSFQASSQDPEELRRSRSAKDLTMEMTSHKSFSSPAKTRPGLQRSISDSRARRPHSSRAALGANTLGRQAKGRQSPVKQLSRPNLASIPESMPSTRASVTFTIDENGRAHSHTTLTSNEPRTSKGGPAASSSEGDSSSDESSDDEPIVVPSRTSSFAMPQASKPKMGNFSTGSRRRSSENIMGLGRSSSSTSLAGTSASEAETLLDDGSIVSEDGRGEAEIRRVQRARKMAGHGSRMRQPQLMNFGSPGARSEMTDLVDMEGFGTPDTAIRSDISDSTRCVCGHREGDAFMIQCESCEKWLHASCIGVGRQNIPAVYICAFCANTPRNMRRGRSIRADSRAVQALQAQNGTGLASSPLARKSHGRGQ